MFLSNKKEGIRMAEPSDKIKAQGVDIDNYLRELQAYIHKKEEHETEIVGLKKNISQLIKNQKQFIAHMMEPEPPQEYFDRNLHWYLGDCALDRIDCDIKAYQLEDPNKELEELKRLKEQFELLADKDPCDVAKQKYELSKNILHANRMIKWKKFDLERQLFLKSQIKAIHNILHDDNWSENVKAQISYWVAKSKKSSILTAVFDDNYEIELSNLKIEYLKLEILKIEKKIIECKRLLGLDSSIDHELIEKKDKKENEIIPVKQFSLIDRVSTFLGSLPSSSRVKTVVKAVKLFATFRKAVGVTKIFDKGAIKGPSQSKLKESDRAHTVSGDVINTSSVKSSSEIDRKVGVELGFSLGAASVGLMSQSKSKNLKSVSHEIGNDPIVFPISDTEKFQSTSFPIPDLKSIQEGICVFPNAGLESLMPGGKKDDEIPKSSLKDNPVGKSIDDPDKLFLETLHIYNSVKQFDVGKYQELKKNSDIGDGLDHDHIPSVKAIIKSMEVRRGKEISHEEIRLIHKNANAIAVARKLHLNSRTFGGRNTKTQIDKDADDLGAAAAKDLEVFKKNALELGHSEDDINHAMEELHECNRRAGLY